MREHHARDKGREGNAEMIAIVNCRLCACRYFRPGGARIKSQAKACVTIVLMVLALCGAAWAGSESKPLALSYTSSGVTFANLPVLPKQVNGTWTYCSDCAQANPCAGSGSGAVAVLINGGWDCSLAGGSGGGGGGQTFPPSSNLSMGGHSFTSLGAFTAAQSFGGFGGTNVGGLTGAAGANAVLSLMSVNGTLNVLANGVKGDASTDDTAAMQAAMNLGCSDLEPVAMPPASGYKITSPLWENCNNGSLIGSGGFGPLKPAYDFGFTLALVGSAYPGIPLTTSLVTGAGNAFDFRTDQVHNWVNLREWDGVNGPLGSPSGMNVNGLGTFSVEAFAVDTTAGDGVVVSSDSIPNSTTETRAWSLYINAARWGFHVTTSVGSCDATGSASAVSVGTLQYLAGTYDGSTCRLYVCVPGQSNCAVTLSASQTGNLVQDPTEDVTIGPAMGNGWPNGGSLRGAIKGIVDSVRVSNTARYTGTIATVPNAKFSSDSNTLILTNGETAPSSAPFIKAYDGVTFSGQVGYGWLYEYNSNNGALTNQSFNDIENIQISPSGHDVSGLVLNNTHEATLHNIQCGVFGATNCEIGFELWNLAYNNWGLSNLYYVGVPGRYGIAASNANSNGFHDTQMTNAYACEAVNGNTLLENDLCTVSAGASGYYGTAINSGIGGAVTEIGAQDDVEGTQTFTHLYETGNDVIYDGSGGAIAGADGAPAVLLDGGAKATLSGDQIYNQGGSPTEIIGATGAVSNITLLNDRYSSATWGATTPITTSTVLNYCVPGANGTACYAYVANLPACTLFNDHQHYVVVDASTSCSAGVVPTGGGSTYCDVYCAVPGH